MSFDENIGNVTNVLLHLIPLKSGHVFRPHTPKKPLKNKCMQGYLKIFLFFKNLTPDQRLHISTTPLKSKTHKDFL